MHNNRSINRFHGVRRRQIIIRDSECRDRRIGNIMMVNRTRVGRNWLCPARDNHRFAKASLRISRLLQVSREVFGRRLVNITAMIIAKRKLGDQALCPEIVRVSIDQVSVLEKVK